GDSSRFGSDPARRRVADPIDPGDAPGSSRRWARGARVEGSFGGEGDRRRVTGGSTAARGRAAAPRVGRGVAPAADRTATAVASTADLIRPAHLAPANTAAPLPPSASAP